ncbi:MAG: hypothetical protein SH856_08155 [Flavobacteriales bacterium]|nr:hypothetical protein [Flavobacteriales bacterium]
MKKSTILFTAFSLLALFSCDKEEDDNPPVVEPTLQCVVDENYQPMMDPSNFVTVVTVPNTYFPLIAGRTLVLEGVNNEGLQERIEWVTTGATKIIMGVTCFVVNDKVWLEGDLREDTDDWYAQDLAGNVWYFGEDVKDYENGVLTSTAGSWEVGVDGALPGVRMPVNPFPGNIYRQEYYACEAEDMAQDLSSTATIITPLDTYTACAQVEEWTPLEFDAPHEHKYYAPGVGYVRIEKLGTSAYMELVEIIE